MGSIKTTKHFSAGGVILDKGKILLIYRKSKNDFTFPKGHIEKNEDARQAALRETIEETGFQNLAIIEPIGNVEYWWKEEDGIHHKVEEDFLMKLKDKKRQVLEGPEYDDIKIGWFSPQEALEKATYPSVKKQLKRVLKLIKKMA